MYVTTGPTKALGPVVDLTLGWLLKPGIRRSYGGRLTRPMRRWLKIEQALRQTSLSSAVP